jgi:hypothetical protein
MMTLTNYCNHFFVNIFHSTNFTIDINQRQHIWLNAFHEISESLIWRKLFDVRIHHEMRRSELILLTAWNDWEKWSPEWECVFALNLSTWLSEIVQTSTWYGRDCEEILNWEKSRKLTGTRMRNAFDDLSYVKTILLDDSGWKKEFMSELGEHELLFSFFSRNSI